MIPGLGPKDVRTIDAFLNNRCSNPAKYDELYQLKMLFTARFRRGLERLLNGTLLHSGRPKICDVQIGWIDKIPIAGAPQLSSGTEIGDAVIFSYDRRVDRHGKTASLDARAVILQAKIATQQTQIVAPTVPINYSASTPDELALLSSWPIFDLRATGASKTDLLKGVAVTSSVRPPPHAWFIAAPGSALGAAAKGWPSWWMAGRALNGDPCTTTLGQLLVAFLAPTRASPNVGFPFTVGFRSAALSTTGGPLGPPTDWSDLCNTIRWILPRYRAPRSKFPLPPGHFGPFNPRSYSIPWYASMPPSRFHSLMKSAAGQPLNGERRQARDPFRRVRSGGSIVPAEEGPGMFIMSITTTSPPDDFEMSISDLY